MDLKYVLTGLYDLCGCVPHHDVPSVHVLDDHAEAAQGFDQGQRVADVQVVTFALELVVAQLLEDNDHVTGLHSRLRKNRDSALNLQMFKSKK